LVFPDTAPRNGSTTMDEIFEKFNPVPSRPRFSKTQEATS
jgi:hypothetical protein